MKRALIAIAPALLLLAGCPDDDKKAPPPAASASAIASSSATPPATTSAAPRPSGTVAKPSSPKPTYGAANADAVARFDDEKPLGEIEDHVNFDMRARTAPNTHDSDVITALKAGTPVRKVAKRGQWYLVLFADPHDKSQTLMAWTWEQAFFPMSGPGDEKKLCACWTKLHDGGGCDALMGQAMGECDRTYGDDCAKLVMCVQGQLAPKCMPNERLLAPQNVCAKTCAKNADCPNDQICTDTMGKPNVCRNAKVAEDVTL